MTTPACELCGSALASSNMAGTCADCAMGVSSMGPVSLRTAKARDAAAVWLLTRPQRPMADLLDGLADVAQLLGIRAYADTDPADVPPVPAGTSPFVGWRHVDPEQRKLATAALRDVIQQAQQRRQEASAAVIRKQQEANRRQAAAWGVN
jgi:hypothetical protein